MPAEKTAVSEASTGRTFITLAMAHVGKIQKRESQGQRAAGATKTLNIIIFRAGTKYTRRKALTECSALGD
jgi:hypothetical protein